MTEVSSSVPARVRVAFAHAAVQHLADQHGIDVLHIKGIAWDPDLRASGVGGTDADVLVRPSHVERLLRTLRAHGWVQLNRFETNSSFGHAANARHEHWGYADVHRFFPGMSPPESAFDALWGGRGVRALGGIACPVPDRTGQVLIEMLNTAKDGGPAWTPGRAAALLDQPGDELPQGLVDLVDQTGCHLAFDASLGDLDRHRDAPEYLLWKVAMRGGTRTEEWRAKVRAAPTLRAKAAFALRAPLVNTDHLATRLGHRPSRWEIVREFVDRPRRGLAEEWRVRVRGRARV